MPDDNMAQLLAGQNKQDRADVEEAD